MVSLRVCVCVPVISVTQKLISAKTPILVFYKCGFNLMHIGKSATPLFPVFEIIKYPHLIE